MYSVFYLQNDTIYTYNPDDFVTDGDDTLTSSGFGRNFLNGGAGFDTAAYDDSTAGFLGIRPNYNLDGTLRDITVYHLTSQGVIYRNGALYTRLDVLTSIEAIRTADGVFPLETALAQGFTVSNYEYGESNLRLAAPYTGPLALDTQLVTGCAYEQIAGTARRDFITAGAGNDAVDGGAGRDVIDGGTGSNFLTGGAGIDTFFVDGRGDEITWTTITDWEAGEQLSLWGFIPGSSTQLWSASDGAEGYKGITLHADLDGNGQIDTSITWAGRTALDLPAAREYASEQLLWFVTP